MNIAPLFIALPLGMAFFIPMISRKVKLIPDVFGNLTTACLLVMSLALIGQQGIYKMGGWMPPIGINLVVDGFSVLMLIAIGVVSFASTLFSIRYMELYTSKLRYYSLFLLMVAGMNGVVLTGDMFNLYVFLEIASIASYALVAFGCEHEELEASFRYLVLGCIASCFILFGIALLYGTLGTLNMAHMAQKIQAAGINRTVVFALVSLLMGFSVKAALVPFHAWLPDAHPAAPAPISSMLSGILIKVLGIYAMARVLFNVIGVSAQISTTLIWIGVASMFIGAVLALGQWDFKRLLAYSSISQVGFVVMGLGIGAGVLAADGPKEVAALAILGALFHLINHAVFKSLLFLSSGSIVYSAGTRELKNMGGLKERMPVTAFSSFIGSMSISGIPPFSGFWSKLIIIIAAVKARYFGCALIAAVVSIITLAYYLKAMNYAFFGDLPETLRKVKESPKTMCAAMLFLCVLCVAMAALLIPQIRQTVLDPAVGALTQGTIAYAKAILGS